MRTAIMATAGVVAFATIGLIIFVGYAATQVLVFMVEVVTKATEELRL